jgi:hypothetical protein
MTQLRNDRVRYKQDHDWMTVARAKHAHYRNGRDTNEFADPLILPSSEALRLRDRAIIV